MPTKQTMTQYSVPVKNELGQLNRIAQALAKEQVNIVGLTSETIGDVAYVRFLAERDLTVTKALEDKGFQVFEAPVFCASLPNRPGELAHLTDILEENGINIQTIYGTTNGGEHARLILALDRPDKAEKVLARFTEGLVSN